MTQTVGSRPGAKQSADAPPTISTTQEFPPPPPGRGARFLTWLRSSSVPRRLVIIVPVVAVLVAGSLLGRDGDGGGLLTSGTESAATDRAALDEWRAAAEPILAEIEAAEAAAEDAAAAGDDAATVAQCRAAWERVPAWTDGLLPAPDPEVDRELRAELARLNKAFSSCALSS